MSEYIIRDDELYHYGVMGMKWGVRRSKALLKRTIRQTTKTRVAKLKEIDNIVKKNKGKPYTDKIGNAVKAAREVETLASATRHIAKKILKDIDEGAIKIGRDFVFKNGGMKFDENSEYYNTVRNSYYRYITGY